MSEVLGSAASYTLSAALIVPDSRRRRLLATALTRSPFTIAKEFDAYPSLGDMPDITSLGFHVVVVDLDDDVESALRVIENLCSGDGAMTVMAYSSKNDTDLLRRSMQAGAREFLIDPLLPEAVSEAYNRAAARRPNQGKAPGKTLVFVPTKGGMGVTTVALNFALALTKESGAKVVVVDMDFQLGEVALGLGMSGTFSVVDALMNPARLDKAFLSTLLLKHGSGLSVLPCPEEYSFFHTVAEGAGKLFEILRDEFDYVVVDGGTCHSHIQEALFDIANTIYLVTGINFPALRNAHRLTSFLSMRDGNRELEVVLNRCTSRHEDIDEKSAMKALGRTVNWKIPNDYAAARAAQDSGVPLAMADSPISRVLVQMARSACGKSLTPEKKARKGFSLFGSRALPSAAKV